MEITTENRGNLMMVIAVGRLDGYWADHLTRALDELVRQDHHNIVVNLAGVDYMSSIGIRVLVSFYKKLKAVKGSFSVAEATGNVQTILEMAGLSALFGGGATAETAPAAPVAQSVQRSSDDAHYEIFALGGKGMGLKAMGKPELLDGCKFSAEDCQKLAVGESVVAVGLGAFGDSFAECQDRFGEFFAVAGAAAYQAGDGSSACDFLTSEGDYIPELQSMYSLVCDGSFSQLARFEPVDNEDGKIGLVELAEIALELANAPLACIVIVAESAGLIGASLRKSPAAAPLPNAPFSFPTMREWLSFSTERLDAGSLVLACGVVAKNGQVPAALQPFLRPMGAESGPLGHIHAAPFRYRPLQQGLIDLRRTVRPLFDSESAQGLLHLLGDDREPGQLEQSQFVRGACWIAPLTVEAK